MEIWLPQSNNDSAGKQFQIEDRFRGSQKQLYVIACLSIYYTIIELEFIIKVMSTILRMKLNTLTHCSSDGHFAFFCVVFLFFAFNLSSLRCQYRNLKVKKRSKLMKNN
jgi:hypothetical protein